MKGFQRVKTMEPVRAEPASFPDSEAEVRRLYDLQRAALRSGERSSASQRRERLRSLKRSIERNRDAIRDAMYVDFRKHRDEVDLTEIHPVMTELTHAIRNVGRWMIPVRVPTPLLLFSARSEIRMEPKGHVLILAPWNYPFYLLMAPLVAAVAAGNRAIVRPSEKVPQTGRVIARIVAEAFPEEEVAAVGGGVDIAESLLALPFDHVFFTGSTRVGKRVMHAAAEHLAGVTLELGGKSPAIVDERCDIAAAADRIVWGKLINAGQTCVAPDFALVHEHRVREFVERATVALHRLYGGSEEARESSEAFCRLIDPGAFDRIADALDRTILAGARVEAGGKRDRATRYIAPTILSGVAPDAPIMDEEIFGPVLPVLTYRNLDDAISLVNGRPKPLALYVFSDSSRTVEEVLGRTSAGGSVVNNTVVHLVNPNLPFGGIGASGVGSYHGYYGFRTFSHERAVLVQHKISLGPMLYPPYGPRTKRVLRMIEMVFHR
jgi:aldehyde dehydrogenase (NAD+)